MKTSRRFRRMSNSAVRRGKRALRRHPGAVVMGAGSLAAAAGAVVSRFRSEGLPELPEAGPLAAEAAAAVHNAAKASVISAARESLHPTSDVVLDAVQIAVYEAAAAGVDVTSAALGAVEGAGAIASLIEKTSMLDLAQAAAEAARTAAASAGPIAEQRVAEVLAALITESD